MYVLQQSSVFYFSAIPLCVMSFDILVCLLHMSISCCGVKGKKLRVYAVVAAVLVFFFSRGVLFHFERVPNECACGCVV